MRGIFTEEIRPLSKLGAEKIVFPNKPYIWTNGQPFVIIEKLKRGLHFLVRGI